jgi:RHS repeat-associated protein
MRSREAKYCAGAYKYKYNGKELQDELGLNLYDYGARNYDPALGRWMNVDKLADTYSGISPYVYTLNNPILFIDPDGNYVDDSFIYEKDKKGNYVNPALVKAWTVFANSKQGISFLSNFAEKGQKIAGHEYKESGKYDLKNIDLSFKKLDDNDIANAKTDYEKKGDGLQINILLSQTNTSIPDNIKEIGHESFIHTEMYARDFRDNKKLDNSTDNDDIVNWVDAAIKKGYPKNYRDNLIQHTQEINSKILNAKLLPILQDYYKNAGIKKKDAEIIKKINGYLQ